MYSAMKTILMALLSGLYISINAQETDLSIKSESSEINGKISDGFYKQDQSQLKNLISILNSDVFEYYDIKSKYETDLKRKDYMESDDYKLKYSKLEELKSQLTLNTFYLDFAPEYYETDNLVKSSSDAKNFSVFNSIEGDSFYNEMGYIQLDRILFKCPSGIITSTRNVNNVCYAFIEETISFKIDNDTLALKIRENSGNLRLLFIFSFTGISAFRNIIPDKESFSYHLMTSMREVIVYNSKTNEIYFTFK
jgi:hypothetical protein